MLHPSLIELAEQAPRCQDLATARGVVVESHQLFRNALAHDVKPEALTSWYSDIITSLLRCPAVSLAGYRIVPSGAVGRGEALPDSPISWLLEKNGSLSAKHPETIFQLFHGTHVPIEESDVDPRFLLDAAITTHPSQVSTLSPHQRQDLLTEALALHPPAIKVSNGLPDRGTVVSIRKNLLVPVVRIARWAAAEAGSSELSTPRRLSAAAQAGVLREPEAALLIQGFHSGVRLQLQRWLDGVYDHEVTAETLPALQRSEFGAASRDLSQIFRAIHSRFS
ncbi:hypothetical protein GSS88_00575 [Corynebacterium sp. 3HC-13]|uniref:putative nucleotidyltransferase substrate binding domain-containing protein n=1 Tax=Corynebacterium poyangense TaxID=2684405 RepID=UPI001CCD74DF|nr:putative nucleotidyltransferase substrate binding domain-containing protein [Corynebacterium poyangense]MBZ8176302.1 hypothetical protein [Corynebacterium poyangense]